MINVEPLRRVGSKNDVLVEERASKRYIRKNKSSSSGDENGLARLQVVCKSVCGLFITAPKQSTLPDASHSTGGGAVTLTERNSPMPLYP